MLGTIDCTSSIQVRLDAVKEAFAARQAMSLAARREMNLVTDSKGFYYKRRPRFAQLIRGLERCRVLSESFRVVSRDASETRVVTAVAAVQYGKPTTLKVPLVFACKLPAPRVHSQEFAVDRERYVAKAVVPHPIPEALTAVKQHRHLFDWVELWWVPNDVLIEKLPDPDPIVVGAVQVPSDRVYHFELHRWIDETVEVGWWSKEGY